MKIGVSATEVEPVYTQALSKREAHLLATWERARQATVTIADIRNLVRHARVARDVAWRLARKRVLQRLGAARCLVDGLVAWLNLG